MVEDRGDLGKDALQEVSEQIVGIRRPANDDNPPLDLQGLFTSFRANTPWLDIKIDRPMVKTLGVSMA